MLVGLILTILLGALVGWIASIIMRRDAEQGALGNILIGIGGAFLGSFLRQLAGQGNGSGFWIHFDFWDILWALIGAIILCAILNYYNRRQLR